MLNGFWLILLYLLFFIFWHGLNNISWISRSLRKGKYNFITKAWKHYHKKFWKRKQYFLWLFCGVLWRKTVTTKALYWKQHNVVWNREIAHCYNWTTITFYLHIYNFANYANDKTLHIHRGKHHNDKFDKLNFLWSIIALPYVYMLAKLMFTEQA